MRRSIHRFYSERRKSSSVITSIPWPFFCRAKRLSSLSRDCRVGREDSRVDVADDQHIRPFGNSGLGGSTHAAEFLPGGVAESRTSVALLVSVQVRPGVRASTDAFGPCDGDPCRWVASATARCSPAGRPSSAVPRR